MAIHELTLERRTLHGHFSRDLAPVLTVESGATVAMQCLDAGWNYGPGRTFEPREPGLDDGHALTGPIEVRDARPGQTLEVRIDRVHVAPQGFMQRERGLERRDALAFASLVVDLRVTQMVNEVRGVHAVLPDNAIR